MATFHYRGLDSSGRLVRGLIAADTPRAARDRLRETGVLVSRMAQRASHTEWNALAALKRKRYSHSLTEFVRETATLLQAGVPLLEAIDSSIPSTSRGLQSPLAALRDQVAGGASLADAMQSEGWLFDDMMIGMVRVGEHAGNLESVLDQLAAFREQSAQLRDRVLSAILYPAIVFAVSIGVSIFLMTVVVPMLLENLEELGKALPWPTRVLRFLSNLLLAHGWWFFGAIAMLALASVTWLQTESGKASISRMVLRIPVLGGLVRKQSIGRMSMVVACLLRSGVELVEALSIAEHACRNIVLRNSLIQIRHDLESGKGLRESIAKHPVFPPAVAQIFAIGQQSGQLEDMLERLGTDYDRQAGVLAGRVASIAEPLLILALSVVVGFILFATVLPILEAGNVLSN